MTSLSKPHNYETYSLEKEWEAVGQLKRGNLEFLEPVLQFLEYDPYVHGSGYLKELAWRRLRNTPLDEKQKVRLRRTALSYVKKRLTREFPAMARCIHFLADNFLRSEIEKLQQAEDSAIRRRAIILSAYCDNLEQGEKVKDTFYFEWLRIENNRRRLAKRTSKH